LQQVGAKGFAIARPADPHHYPLVTSALRRRALAVFGHAWVLHRRVFVQAAGAFMALLLIVGLYQARDLVVAGVHSVVRVVQGEFVAAGFGINRIQISGQALTRDRDIVSLLTLAAGSSTLDFDVERARALLGWLRAVDSVTVRKVYPNSIIVDIVEKVPLARWRIGHTTHLIDGHGASIGIDTGLYSELPLVVGHGAANDALVTLRLLERHPELKTDLAALSRIGDRRWDLIYYSGLRVQLPEVGVAQALSQLEMYQNDYALLDRDVTLIDLRVPGVVALKPGATVTDAEAKKKP
jgi:cell division protein FtsQ